MHVYRNITRNRGLALRESAPEQVERGRCSEGCRRRRRVGATGPGVTLRAAKVHLYARIVQLVCVLLFLFGPQLFSMEAYAERRSSVIEVREGTEGSVRIENDSFRMGVSFCK